MVSVSFNFYLADKNNSYAIYLRAVGTTETSVKIETGKGNYAVQVINTLTGSYSDPVTMKSSNDILDLDVAIPDGELALKILKTK